MANKFYEPGEQRAAKVGDLFATVARRYDLLNDLQSLGLHRRWKRRLVELANPRPGERALDLCCGTGDIALLLAARGAEVTGLDFSEPMLAIARQRKNPKSEILAAPKHGDGGRNPEFIAGDAQSLPFPDAGFDIVTVGYGLRNLSSVDGGLREMRRVLKVGGRLLILDFGKPANALWRALYYAHLRTVVPSLGRIFCPDASAYAYILESLKHYPGQAGVAAMLRELGLAEIQIVNLLGGAMSIHFAKKPN